VTSIAFGTAYRKQVKAFIAECVDNQGIPYIRTVLQQDGVVLLAEAEVVFSYYFRQTLRSSRKIRVSPRRAFSPASYFDNIKR